MYIYICNDKNDYYSYLCLIPVACVFIYTGTGTVLTQYLVTVKTNKVTLFVLLPRTCKDMNLTVLKLAKEAYYR